MSESRMKDFLIQEASAHGCSAAIIFAERADSVTFKTVSWHVCGMRFENKAAYVLTIDRAELCWRYPEGFDDPKEALEILAVWLVEAEHGTTTSKKTT